MLSKTLQDGLNDYGIGAKIRALRLKKKIGLVELGKHTGLSPALLSKIERGRLFPTLPTLLRIALVFGVGLEYFFAGEASLGRSYQQVLQAARSNPPFGPDWIALHLRRLANNIGEARLFAGVHWRGDHVAGQKIGRAAARVIIDQLKADCVPDFMLRSCPDGAGVTPPDPDALAKGTRAARASVCPIEQDRIEQPSARGAAFRAMSGTF